MESLLRSTKNATTVDASSLLRVEEDGVASRRQPSGEDGVAAAHREGGTAGGERGREICSPLAAVRSGERARYGEGEDEKDDRERGRGRRRGADQRRRGRGGEGRQRGIGAREEEGGMDGLRRRGERERRACTLTAPEKEVGWQGRASDRETRADGAGEGRRASEGASPPGRPSRTDARERGRETARAREGEGRQREGEGGRRRTGRRGRDLAGACAGETQQGDEGESGRSMRAGETSVMGHDGDASEASRARFGTPDAKDWRHSRERRRSCLIGMDGGDEFRCDRTAGMGERSFQPTTLSPHIIGTHATMCVLHSTIVLLGFT